MSGREFTRWCLLAAALYAALCGLLALRGAIQPPLLGVPLP